MSSVPEHASTLLEQIGGPDAVDAAVELFYDKVMKDSRINSFFDDVDMKGQRAKQKKFFNTILGGNLDAAADYMRRAHKNLVEEGGLNDGHFDAVAENLASSLEELNVPAKLIGEVMGAAASLREPVLNR